MTPEVLIVGDASRRTELLERIQQLGYRATMSTETSLEQRVAKRQVPAAVVVCTEDVDPQGLMAELRSTRLGSGVPVTLHGPLGGRIGDLADVLDLGADHFLEEPADDEQLMAAMNELAGPGGPGASPEGSAEAPSGTTEVVMGQLHRTLDALEARLREREQSDADADDLDLAELGFAELPQVDEESSAPAAGHGSNSSLELPLSRANGTPESTSRQRDPTERLGAPPPRSSHEPDPAAADGGAGDRPRRRSPLPVEAEGSLERLEVPRLLWALHQAQYTGALSLEHGRVDKRLWWRDGDVVFVRSNVGHDRLVDGLLRRGLLTREQYDTARRLAAKEPGRVGPLLVEAGFLKSAEWPRVLRHHLIRIIDSCFPWAEGTWVLTPDEDAPESILVDTPVPLVVAEGIRHRMESAQLIALLGGLDQYPRFRHEAAVVGGPRALAERLMMSPTEEAWIARLDGTRRLGELVEHPATDELELLGVIYMLHVLEHLELLANPGGAASDAEPEVVDTARILERLRIAREGDYFEALGVPRDALRLDVRRAHAQLVQTFADENLAEPSRQAREAELVELRALLDEARDVLANASLRNAYLAHLEEP